MNTGESLTASMAGNRREHRVVGELLGRHPGPTAFGDAQSVARTIDKNAVECQDC
jgi:hypothetical protein